MKAPKRINVGLYILNGVAVLSIVHYLSLLRALDRKLMFPSIEEGRGMLPWFVMSNSSTLEPTTFDTSIVVASSLIPTHPDIRLIHETIQSIYRYLDGLPEGVPLIIVFDVLKKSAIDADRRRYVEVLQNLSRKFPQAQLLIQINEDEQGLVYSVKMAVDSVRTKYMYLVQQDLKFIAFINHTGLVKTMNEYPELDIVRFDQRKNKPTKPEKEGMDCFGRSSVLDDVNAVHFTKSASWSDSTNQFASKQYYVNLLQNWFSDDWVDPAGDAASTLPMEQHMMAMAEANCSRYGTWLYGRKIVDGPYVFRLDGRLVTAPPTIAAPKRLARPPTPIIVAPKWLAGPPTPTIAAPKRLARPPTPIIAAPKWLARPPTPIIAGPKLLARPPTPILAAPKWLARPPPPTTKPGPPLTGSSSLSSNVPKKTNG